MERATAGKPGRVPALGLRANAGQFTLLVLVNAFVGAMVGLERSILPRLGQEVYGVGSRTALLSFLASFGVVKAGTNYLAGRLGDRYGRRRVLIAGWLFGIPVPLLVIWAPSWGWVVVANVLLGVNQGLAWSTTVVMKIDLVGPRRRGLAMGLNEFSGYLAVAASAYAAGLVATRWGIHPAPFYLGIAIAAAGLSLTMLFVRETMGHVRSEQGMAGGGEPIPAGEIFRLVSWRHPALSSCSQAGLVNNLNDGLAWGIFPLLFAAGGLSMARTALLAAAYPASWSFGQLATGALSDRVGRKWLIVGGMLVQGVALFAIAAVSGFTPWLWASIVLGLGTAMVYPTLLAAIGDVAAPGWRGSAVGIYRLWRDSGYAVGALLSGLVADLLGLGWAVGVVGAITVASGLLVAVRMPETLRADEGPPTEPREATASQELAAVNQSAI